MHSITNPQARPSLSHALSFAFLAFWILLSPSCTLKPPPFDEATWRARVKATNPDLVYAGHFKEGRFLNPWMPQQERGVMRLLKWRFSPAGEYTDEEQSYLPEVMTHTRERLLKAQDRDLLLWVGHGTFLIRLNGEYWLTDPVLSDRAFWPKRKTPPGISLKDLKAVAPRLNVIISHNHYDHLDKKTLLSLPEDTRIVVPLGLKSYVEGLNKRNVIHMDWWQRLDCEKDVRLVCLPMQHWSRRIGQGLNETLWASYMLMTPKRTIYFGGDSGYFIGYREIGKRYPGIDYALLPTTAYHPRWFMHYAHMNIDETLEAFNDLGARYMIPHQWGTFQLGDEPAGYPALDLKRTIARRGLDPSRFILLRIGEIYLLEDTPL